jgi:hypothetical protein
MFAGMEAAPGLAGQTKSSSLGKRELPNTIERQLMGFLPDVAFESPAR